MFYNFITEYTDNFVEKKCECLSAKASLIFSTKKQGRVAQSVGHVTRKSEVLGSIPGLATYFVSPSADSRGAVVSYWQKYVHEVLINRFGGLSLPRKSVVRLTDRPDMTLDVYRGRKTTTQQQQQLVNKNICVLWILTFEILTKP